jgi:hypothetical protein
MEFVRSCRYKWFTGYMGNFNWTYLKDRIMDTLRTDLCRTDLTASSAAIFSFTDFMITLTSCEIWGFHGGYYEECRLLEYESPLHTSQGTHYISHTEPSRLLQCTFWFFHGGDYEECLILLRTDVSEECNTSIISVKRISELRTTLTVTRH